MKAKHVLTAQGKCPVDGADDAYEVVVKVRRVLKVEDILAVVADLTRSPIYQEAFTQLLASRLDARVRTTCIHSGVVTVVRA